MILKFLFVTYFLIQFFFLANINEVAQLTEISEKIRGCVKTAPEPDNSGSMSIMVHGYTRIPGPDGYGSVSDPGPLHTP